MVETWVLAAALFAVAFLYSSVGHAGASGYIAVMGIVGMAAVVIRPTSLALNIIVGSIAAIQFARAGHFRWALFWPFALPAVPLAFFGGALRISNQTLELILGGFLVVSAILFWIKTKEREDIHAPQLPVALISGAVIGVLAGMTGTGGGIFLTPLLLFAGWSNAKNASAVSAAFILCNSLSGLGGFLWRGGDFPSVAWPLALAVVVGGLLGSTLGAKRFNTPTVKRLLGAVLLIASWKLLAG
jgi:uncharacterized membrane protein YfcA